MNQLIAKKPDSFILLALLSIIYYFAEINGKFGCKIKVYYLIFMAILLIISFIFRRKETIKVIGNVLHLSLDRYNGEFNLEKMTNIELRETVNDLIIETNGSKHFFKLHGFKRSKVEDFVSYVNEIKKKSIILKTLAGPN